MRPSECDFTVPERLFPLSPPELRGERRDHARPAVLDRSCTRLEHGRFDKLGSYLREGDVLVVNNTKMVHDQLRGQTSRGPVRLVLFGHHVDGWHAAVSPASRGARGLVVRIGGDELRGVLVRRTFEDMWLVKFEHDGDFYELLERHGERNVPLYKPLRDQQQTYLNVYTTEPGSLEIRSAGLHFTREMLERLERRGVRIVPITLHIGLTELQSHRHIVEENVEDHEVGSEWYRVRPSAARAMQRCPSGRGPHRRGRDERRTDAGERGHGGGPGPEDRARRGMDRPLHLPRPPLHDGRRDADQPARAAVEPPAPRGRVRREAVHPRVRCGATAATTIASTSSATAC